MRNPLTRPITLLRLEGAAVLVLAVTGYARFGGNWIVFAVLQKMGRESPCLSSRR